MITKTSKEFRELFNAVKQTIAGNGICSITGFKEIIEGHEIDAAILLGALQEEGIVYTKVDGYGEVLVDVRLMVATMLIAYSHKWYAKTNLVMELVELVFDIYAKGDILLYTTTSTVLREAYKQIGHNYTLSKVAENAVINREQSEWNAGILFEHNRGALRVLSRNDADLTAIYRLAKHAFDVCNGWVEGSVAGMRRASPETNSTYNYFHQLAANMVNKHKPRK